MRDELTVLIWMANPADVRVVSRLLRQAGLAFEVCEDIDAFTGACGNGGVLLLEEESLSTPEALPKLQTYINNQPPWSDLPVVLLGGKIQGIAGKGKSRPRFLRNLTLLERPVSSASLVSVLEVALQSRQRQYEVRDLLADLEELNKSLEQRVAERTSELKRRTEEEKRLTAELGRSNKELEQFAYIVSHDLKSPLHTITGFLGLLARRCEGQLDPKADELIFLAVEGAERMRLLINDILALSKVGTRGNPFEQLDVRETLDQALRNLNAEIEESGAKISFGDLPLVLADKAQLTLLFQNLIGNAVKYRKPEEPPRIQIDAKAKNGIWEFRVQDNGIGLDPKFAERIFQVFQRLHTVSEYSGTGIGLAICKKIVERHNGRIWVESEPGKGSTFFFTLPKA